MTLKIEINQIEKALAAFDAIKDAYENPMARIETNQPGWVIEIEKIHLNGEERLRSLKAAGRQLGTELELQVEGVTANRTRPQFYIRALRCSIYALNTEVRDPEAINYIRRS